MKKLFCISLQKYSHAHVYQHFAISHLYFPIYVYQ